MIYICFPVYNRIQLTIKCIESILTSTFKDYKIVILDDGSTDGSTEIINETYPDIIILKGDGTFFWAKGMNTCLEYVLTISNDNDFVLMLNNDVEIEETTLNELIFKYQSLNTECILGCFNLIIDNKNCIENSGYIIKKYGFIQNLNPRFKHYAKIDSVKEELIKVDSLAAKGAFLSIKIIKKIGLIDEYHFRQYHGDSTYFYRTNIYNIPIFIYVNAKLYSHLYLTGAGAEQHNCSFKEIITSFFTFKSGNYFKTIYFRSKIFNNNSIIAFIQTSIIIGYKIIKWIKK